MFIFVKRMLFTKNTLFHDSCYFMTAITQNTQAQSRCLSEGKSIVFFNTYGCEEGDGSETITLSIHGWIFEKKKQSLWRSFARKQWAKICHLPTSGPEYKTFTERAHYFFAHNRQNEKLIIQIGNKQIDLPLSQKDGHFKATFTLTKSNYELLPKSTWISYQIDEYPIKDPELKGQCNIISVNGISVISDIDDTMKVTNVLNEEEKLKNVFIRPFKSTPGTAKAYRKWEAQGAVFHYVSGSPWQLYPFLEDGIRNANFPQGSFDLRTKDMSIYSFFKPDEYNGLKHKLAVIRKIIKTYPLRKFILVGDCSEQDPEVYSKIYDEFPANILHIFVREVEEADMSDVRFQNTFKDVPLNLWDIFSDGSTDLLNISTEENF